MRVIAIKTIRNYAKRHTESDEPLKTWYKEVSRAEWKNHNELKAQIGNASVINKKRVVFNIKGNDFRLVVDVEYRIGLVFIIWLGTHSEYDKINVEEVNYD